MSSIRKLTAAMVLMFVIMAIRILIREGFSFSSMLWCMFMGLGAAVVVSVSERKN